MTIQLTQKEVDRADNGITIISRQQSKGGYKVMAVRVKGHLGTPLSMVTAEMVETKADIGRAAKEVGRWVSKMGYDSKMADAARHRHKPR